MGNWTIHSILPPALPLPIEPNRGGYTLTMRESAGADAALAELAEDDGDSRQADTGRAHVGWGSFRNLDIAAARRSSWVLLLDINRHQFRVWEGVRQAMDDPACKDAAAFVAAVVPLLPHQPRLRQFVPDTHDWLLGDLDRPESWLYRDRPERFRHIRDLFRTGRVATGCVDLRAPADHGIFHQMAERIEAATARGAAEFDTLYVSNLPWMLAQREGFFGESNAQLAAPGNADVLAQVRGNLAAIAPRFRHVVEAGQLAPTSHQDDLQWRTGVLSPEAFLDQSYWTTLTPVSGAFRSLA